MTPQRVLASSPRRLAIQGNRGDGGAVTGVGRETLDVCYLPKPVLLVLFDWHDLLLLVYSSL